MEQRAKRKPKAIQGPGAEVPGKGLKLDWNPGSDPGGRATRRQCDPVGAVEIAERLKVKRGTVDMWRQRNMGFPPPRWTVGGRPAWNWDEISYWFNNRPVRPSAKP